MQAVQNKTISKNKQLNNSIHNSSGLDLEDANKAIELTRFNVSNIFYNF